MLKEQYNKAGDIYASCPVFLRLNLLCCRLGFHLKLKIVPEEQDGIR